MSDEFIAVKAVGDAGNEYKLRVLGLPHGVDRQGQVFDAQTDLGDAGEIPVYYWHGYGEQSAKAVKLLGRAVRAERDAQGQWFDTYLKKGDPRAEKIYSDAAKGMARASSDSAPHLVRPVGIVGKAGRVSSWPILAMSLMDAETASTAVNPQAIAVPALKALYEEFIGNESDSGEAAAKAGAKIARRNRERLQHIMQLLDEIKGEFPDESENSNLDAKAHVVADAATKAGNKKMESDELLKKITSMIDQRFTDEAKRAKEAEDAKKESETAAAKAEAAVKAQVDAQLAAKLKEFNDAAVKAGRPALFQTEQTNDAAKADAAKAESAWMRYFRSGDRSGVQLSDAAKATMNEGTAAQGGFLVPIKYSNEVVKPILEGSLIRQAGARVISVDGTTAFKVPTLTNTSRAVLTAESAAFNQNEPTLGEVEFAPYKYTRLSKVTDELLNDSRIDTFGQIVAPDAANAFILGENADFTTGSGSGQPQGIVTGASLGVTAAAVAAITTDELIDLYHSLSYLYRTRAVWMMNDATLKLIRKLKDSTNQYIWQPGLQAGQPDTLLGRPVFVNNNMAVPATGVRSVLFGDFSYYWISDFAQLEMRRLDELYAGTGEVGFRWYKRYDGRMMLPSAVRYLAQA
jgi:HK97 family phage major capsid protein